MSMTRDPGSMSEEAGAGSGSLGPVLSAGPLPPRVVRHRVSLASRRRRVVAAVVVFAAIGFLLYEMLTNAAVYFLTTKQAVAQRAQLGTQPFRIEGTVEPDVVEVGKTVRFSIYNDGVSVRIIDSGSPPQLFKPGIPVVLEGHWQGSVYLSDQIMVKHTAKYAAAHPNRLKSQLPAAKTTPATPSSPAAKS